MCLKDTLKSNQSNFTDDFIKIQKISQEKGIKQFFIILNQKYFKNKDFLGTFW